MRLLDLFCGAGGAAMGYHRAGFDEIVGVDIKPQPHYPFKFVQACGLAYLVLHGREFDAIHASPPCQGYSIMHNLPWLKGREYPLFIFPLRLILESIGRPWVLENVMGARHGSKTLKKRGLEAHGLKAGWLCGTMFGRPFYRHRLFATNWLWLAPGHPKHKWNLHPRSERYVYGGTVRGLPGGAAGLDVSPVHPKHRPYQPHQKIVHIPIGKGRGQRNGVAQGARPNPVNSKWRAFHDGTSPQLFVDSSGRVRRVNNKLSLPNEASGLTMRPGYEKLPFAYPSLTNWQNGARAEGVGIGQAKGWKLAAEAMGIDWMTRGELTQAVPPCYTEYIGRYLKEEVTRGTR